VERTATVVIVERVAVMPVPVVRPASVAVPPAGVIPPIPGTAPCVPCIAPEPIVDNGTIDIYRFDDIVRSVDILVADDLYFDFVFGVFLYVDRGYILEYIFREDCLQDDKAFVTFSGLYNPKVIHLPVSVEVQITERTVGVVEHRLELLQVLSLCEQFSYHLQIESLGDVRTLGGNSDCFIRP